MKRKLINIFILIIFALTNGKLIGENIDPYIKKFSKKWDKLYMYPSKKNVIATFNIMNYKTLSNQFVYKFNYNLKKIKCDEGFSDCYYCLWENGVGSFSLLAMEAYSGMEEAIRLYFKLYILADKQKYRDEIIFVLGNLIRINPELFLKEADYLLKSENRLKEKIFKEILTRFTPHYKNNQEYELFEIKERIKAIKSVKDRKYEKTKNRCLKLLGEKEKDLMKIVKDVKIEDIIKFIDKETPQPSDKYYPLMGKEVYSGNRAIFPLFFKKLNNIDGDQPGLPIIFSNLIRINPKLFLEELNKCKNLRNRFIEKVIFTDVGYYVDNPNLRLREMKLRRRSLERILDEKLLKLRDECIYILKKTEEELRNVIKEYESDPELRKLIHN